MHTVFKLEQTNINLGRRIIQWQKKIINHIMTEAEH